MAAGETHDTGADRLGGHPGHGAGRASATGEAAWRFPPTRAAPRAARRLLGLRLLVWGIDARAGTLVLHVANELVTNAVEHARTDLELTVRLAGSLLTITVRDQGGGQPRVIPIGRDGRGWGLRLVEGLAARWGYTPASNPVDGKIVWAEVPLG